MVLFSGNELQKDSEWMKLDVMVGWLGFGMMNIKSNEDIIEFYFWMLDLLQSSY